MNLLFQASKNKNKDKNTRTNTLYNRVAVGLWVVLIKQEECYSGPLFETCRPFWLTVVSSKRPSLWSSLHWHTQAPLCHPSGSRTGSRSFDWMIRRPRIPYSYIVAGGWGVQDFKLVLLDLQSMAGYPFMEMTGMESHLNLAILCAWWLSTFISSCDNPTSQSIGPFYRWGRIS